MMAKQHTIQRSVEVSGVGLHTGAMVTLTFKPAPENHGFKFQRIDLEGQPIVAAEVSRVSSTKRGTTLQAGEAQVSTVEHVLAALTGLQIDNVLMEIDGPEVPIMDGSAQPFIAAVQEAGKQEQNETREVFEIQEPIYFRDEETGTEMMALPAERYEVTTLIDFNSDVLGPQFAALHDITDFEKEIAPCRTFVFLHELEYLFKQNLIKGGNLDNAIVIVDRVVSQAELDNLSQMLGKPSVKVEKEGILNTLKLHFRNEPARHKLLDVIGDLALLGLPIKGRIVATKPGHRTNVEFTKVLKSIIKNRRG